VSNVEGEDREFDELDLPAEDLGEPTPEDETLDFDAAGEVPEPVGETGAPAEGPEAEGLGEPVGPAESDALEDFGMPADEGFPAEAPEEELEEEAEGGPGFLEKLAAASPYVVLLGISLAAVLIGILCLFLELKDYGFETKPAQARIAPAVQSGPPSTTATA
jgi:hypothetical protein